MLVLAALAALAWLIQLLLALRIAVLIPRLSSLKVPEREVWPKLSILVPARDEGAELEGALRSKLSASYPNLELVAIDDRSSDRTGEVIDQIAATDPRVRAAHVKVLPEGWLGKLNAMNIGLAQATGEWVLFSDADVHVEPGVLEKLINFGEKQHVDFIAVFPQMRSVSWWIDAGTAVLLRVLTVASRCWAANDDRSKVAVGVGAFNLVRRSALETTRVLETLKMEVADDVGMGAVLKHHGLRCRFFVGGPEVHLVFLDSLKAAMKSADKGGGMLGYSIPKSIVLALAPLSFEVGVPLAAICLGGQLAVFGALALIFGTGTHLVLSIFVSAPLRGALLWPLGQMLTSALTLRAGLLAWKNQGIYWRDTFYSRKQLEAGRRIRIPSLSVISAPPAAERGS